MALPTSNFQLPTVKSIFIIFALINIAVWLSGCSTTTTMIEKRSLDVQSKMSDTIFLQPVSPKDKTIFIQIRNTSDRDINNQDVTNRISAALTSKGYVVVDDPEKANFMLQSNILSVAKANKEEAYGALEAGYGGALAGAAVGGFASNSGRGALGGALLGAAIGTVANALVKDVYINVVTDIQIQQKAKKGQKVTTTVNANSTSGMSANTNQIIHDENSNWITYRTRIVTVANKMNLEFEEAQPVLIDGLIRSTSGIF